MGGTRESPDKTVRIHRAARQPCWAVVGDLGRDPSQDWPRAFPMTCPLVVAGPGPVGALA